MSAIKDGGAAFPYLDDSGRGLELHGLGMTLRDYFAAKAMQSLVLAAYTSSVQVGAESEVAQQAYSFADAMLAEREE